MHNLECKQIEMCSNQYTYAKGKMWSNWNVIKMECDQSGMWSKWNLVKMAYALCIWNVPKMECDQNGMWWKLNVIKMEYDQNGMWPKWNVTKTECDQNGIWPKRNVLKIDCSKKEFAQILFNVALMIDKKVISFVPKRLLK